MGEVVIVNEHLEVYMQRMLEDLRSRGIDPRNDNDAVKEVLNILYTNFTVACLDDLFACLQQAARDYTPVSNPEILRMYNIALENWTRLTATIVNLGLYTPEDFLRTENEDLDNVVNQRPFQLVDKIFNGDMTRWINIYRRMLRRAPREYTAVMARLF